MIAANMDMQSANEANDIAMVILEMHIFITYIIHAVLNMRVVILHLSVKGFK